MARSKPSLGSKTKNISIELIRQKTLAEHLGLSKTAFSLVINRVPAAKSIPHRTQELIRAAARELNYRPNHLARSLRQQRSYTIGVLVPEISEGYAALVMSGIEDHLLQEGYFYFVVSHRHRNELIEEYPLLLQQRAVEGLIAVDTALSEGVQVPVVAVSGHRDLPGVTNIVLNHARAATQALREAGRSIPEDVSVVGFDDIQSAAFQNPGLTTVKQPLRQMGVLAAETVLQRINAPVKHPYPKEIIVEPDFVVRGSTAPAARNGPHK